ncbi:MAG: hypothetical protein WA975_04455 [Mesorhizobium sp.]
MSLDRDLDAISDWESIRPARPFRMVDAGMGLLRLTLLFGSAAVALAMIVTPILDRHTRQRDMAGYPAGLDMTVTGSIGSGTYTLRRSVLQRSPEAACIIRNDGRLSGDC